MAKKKYEEANIKAIADAIRSISSSAENTKYKVSEMPIAIINGGADCFNRGSTEGYTAGRTDGYNDGYNKGAEAGYQDGYESGEEVGWTDGYADGSTDGYNVGLAEGETAGKQAEGLAYWNAITNNGARSSWSYAFSYSDYSEIEFPKPVVIKGSAQRLFRMYAGKKLPRKQDIDMSGVTDVLAIFSYIYSGDRKMTIPDYGIPVLDSYETFCDNSACVETIEIIRCHEGTTFSSSFANCSGLKNITFEGVIGKNLYMQYSPLSVSSLKSIIACLKDYTGINEYGYTLTLKSSAFSSLEAEGATAEYNGVACTWRELIDNKKWNLTLK